MSSLPLISDLNDIISTYAPATAVDLPPERRRRILKVITGIDIPDEQTAAVLAGIDLSNPDSLDYLVTLPILYPYLRQHADGKDYSLALRHAGTIPALLELQARGELITDAELAGEIRLRGHLYGDRLYRHLLPSQNQYPESMDWLTDDVHAVAEHNPELMVTLFERGTEMYEETRTFLTDLHAGDGWNIRSVWARVMDQMDEEDRGLAVVKAKSILENPVPPIDGMQYLTSVQLKTERVAIWKRAVNILILLTRYGYIHSTVWIEQYAVRSGEHRLSLRAQLEVDGRLPVSQRLNYAAQYCYGSEYLRPYLQQLIDEFNSTAEVDYPSTFTLERLSRQHHLDIFRRIPDQALAGLIRASREENQGLFDGLLPYIETLPLSRRKVLLAALKEAAVPAI